MAQTREQGTVIYMYIKIKHIKQFFLISACAFFALFNYFTYAKADDATGNTSQAVCDKAVDSDCDGLTDSEEKLYGTDPTNADTDGDSYSDGVEVKSGYDPLVAAPEDRISTGVDTNTADSSTGQASTATGDATLTDTFSQDLQSFVDTKGTDPITTSDIQSFTAASLAEKTGAPITWDTLPEVDRSTIKIINQPYASLTDDASKTKVMDDASTYIVQIAYLVMSNSPKPITSLNDLTSLADDFKNHIVSLSTTNPDVAYFTDLGNRANLFLQQVTNVAVPETILEMHIKVLRLMKGLLALGDVGNPTQDPVAEMIILSKAQDYTNLVNGFIANDIMNYVNQISPSQ